MLTIRIPTPLRPYANHQTTVELHGSTVGEAVQDLVQRHPDLQPHLFSAEGELRSFVHLFLNEEDVRELQGLDTPLRDGDRLMLVPSVAGGRV